MSRQFPDGAGITLAVGSAGVLSGAWTFAAIVKRTADGTRALLALQASGSNHRGGLWLTSTGGLQVVAGGEDRTFGITIPLDTWVLVAATRVAGANKTPRGHMYRYDTGVWTHANSVTGSLGNDATAIVSVELGRSFADWFFVGLMANAGVWNRALSDVDVEGLELALQAWVDATPVALWPLNQTSVADPVQDIIGAADQTSITGTSVSADEPAGWSYTLGGGGSTVSGVATAALGGLTAAAAGDRTVHGQAVAPLGALTATVVVAGATVKADSTATLAAGGSSVPSVSAGRTSVATITARRTSTPEVSSG